MKIFTKSGASKTVLPDRMCAVMRLGRADRYEFVVYMVCADWTQLVEFLADPNGFMRAQQYMYGQQAEDYIDWVLLDPTTTRIHYAGDDRDKIDRMGRLYNELKSAKGARGLLNISSFRRRQAGFHGLFSVEYSAYTRTAQVTYLPPTGEYRDYFYPHRAGQFAHDNDLRYTGQMLEPVILTTQQGIGTLHIDIAPEEVIVGSGNQKPFSLEPRNRNTAKFVAELMADPGRMIARINTIGARVEVGQVVQPGERIVFPKPSSPGQQQQPPKSYEVVLPNKERTARLGSSGPDGYLDIVFNSTCDSVYNCHNGQVNLEDGVAVLLESNLVPYMKTQFLPDRR